MDAGRIPPAEDVETIRRASPVSPGVRAQRELEEWTDKLALALDRETRRAAKGKGRSAAPTVETAKTLVEQIDADAARRPIHTHGGKTVPFSLVRENALKLAEIEVGIGAPIHVRCAHCGEVFRVKAGTAAQNIPKTCLRGCKCACGARVSRGTARVAAGENRRAMCLLCAAAKARATISPEAINAAAAKGRAARTPEARSAAVAKGRAAMTSEARSAAAAKGSASAAAARRAKAAAKTHCARGHEFAVVGRGPTGNCAECNREYRRARRAAAKARNA